MISINVGGNRPGTSPCFPEHVDTQAGGVRGKRGRRGWSVFSVHEENNKEPRRRRDAGRRGEQTAFQPEPNTLRFKGIVYSKWKFHSFTTHRNVDGGSGDTF